MADALTEPVTVLEVREYLRQDTDDDDALLARLIPAARATIEAETGYGLIATSREVTLTPFSAAPHLGLSMRGEVPMRLALPYAPISAITAVQALDPETGTWQDVDEACYAFDARNLFWLDYPVPSNLAYDFDLTHGVKVTYTGGYTRATCPDVFKMAIIQRVVYLYDGRQPTGFPEPPRRCFL